MLTAKLIDQLLTWPEVIQQPHRFGGIEFQFRGKEIGHLHGDYLVDLLLPKAVRDQLVASGRAEPHHMFPDSGWVSVYLKSNEDVHRAIELLRLKYEDLVTRQAKSELIDNRIVYKN
ncbi:luciferase family protein [Paenibacillus sp. SI8]|uniref:luciferase domain-containing protein n=1 Tax=unclassified Paenibacillus TaxID=185978 RepID=UPI003467574F